MAQPLGRSFNITMPNAAWCQSAKVAIKVAQFREKLTNIGSIEKFLYRENVDSSQNRNKKVYKDNL